MQSLGCKNIAGSLVVCIGELMLATSEALMWLELPGPGIPM